MVALAATEHPETVVLPTPTFSDAAIRELGGSIRFVAKIRYQTQIEPRLITEDYGMVPAEVAVSNGRAIAAGHGAVFAAYSMMGVASQDDVMMHVIWKLGPVPAITVRLAVETTEAG